VFHVSIEGLGALFGELSPPKPLHDYGTGLAGFLNQSPWPPLEATEGFSGSHEQRHLLNSSAVILQNPIDDHGATSVERLCKGATNHERLKTTGLEVLKVFQARPLWR